MPAFFIISGFLYKPHNWLLTLKKFCVPIAFFSLLNLGYVVLRMAAKGEPIDAGELFLRTIPLPIGDATMVTTSPCSEACGLWSYWPVCVPYLATFRCSHSYGNTPCGLSCFA